MGSKMVIAQKRVNGVEKEVMMKKGKEIKKRKLKKKEPPIAYCED